MQRYPLQRRRARKLVFLVAAIALLLWLAEMAMVPGGPIWLPPALGVVVGVLWLGAASILFGPVRHVIVNDDAITTPAPFGRSETIRYGEIAQLGEQDIAGDRFFTMTGAGKRAWFARSRIGDAAYEEIVALVHERCGLPRQTIEPLPEARAID